MLMTNHDACPRLSPDAGVQTTLAQKTLGKLQQ
jgi:hypothetical protein